MTLVTQNETENVVCMMWTFSGQIVLSLNQVDPTLFVMTSTSFGLFSCKWAQLCSMI